MSLHVEWLNGDARATYHGNDLVIHVTGLDEAGEPCQLSIGAHSVEQLAQLAHDFRDALLAQSIDAGAFREVVLRVPGADEVYQ